MEISGKAAAVSGYLLFRIVEGEAVAEAGRFRNLVERCRRVCFPVETCVLEAERVDEIVEPDFGYVFLRKGLLSVVDFIHHLRLQQSGVEVLSLYYLRELPVYRLLLRAVGEGGPARLPTILPAGFIRFRGVFRAGIILIRRHSLRVQDLYQEKDHLDGHGDVHAELHPPVSGKEDCERQCEP